MSTLLTNYKEQYPVSISGWLGLERDQRHRTMLDSTSVACRSNPAVAVETNACFLLTVNT